MVDLNDKNENFAVPSENEVRYFTRAMQFFTPEETDNFIKAQNGDTQRIIFTDQTLLENEKKHWDGFV